MEFEQQGRDSLTGVWHGLYTYASQPQMPESHFVCVLIDAGGHLSGTIHEVMNHYRKPPTDENAIVEGEHRDGQVEFVKTYDGSGRLSHKVRYSGRLNGSREEIEGNWYLRSLFRTYSGRFLMIRRRDEGQELRETTEEIRQVAVPEQVS